MAAASTLNATTANFAQLLVRTAATRTFNSSSSVTANLEVVSNLRVEAPLVRSDLDDTVRVNGECLGPAAQDEHRASAGQHLQRLFDAVEPQYYDRIGGGKDQLGFIAQDVQSAGSRDRTIALITASESPALCSGTRRLGRCNQCRRKGSMLTVAVRMVKETAVDEET